MPELPDLEIFSKNLDRKLSGKQLEEINVKNIKRLNVSAKELQGTLEKQTLKRVYRTGKELYFEFDNDAILSLHLMLKGELHLLKNEESPKYTIIQLLFKDNVSLALTDFQGMAKVALNPPEDETPDALAKGLDMHFFEKLFAEKRAAIKNVLLDQHIIRGIGNAYADEILWEAGISPFSSANKIPLTKLKDLAKALRHVMENAIKQISSAEPDLISGEFRNFLKIHNSSKTHSPSGVPIQIKKSGARKTYYTQEQEIYK